MSRHPADLVVPPVPGSGRPYVTVGVLMTVALAILVVGALWLRQPGGQVYHFELPEAPNLRIGAPVRFRGLAVGQVDDVAFTDTSVRVTIRITRADVPMRRGTAARIGPTGIFGDNDVELVPSATPSAPPLPPGSTLERAGPDSAQLAAEARAAAVRNALARDIIEGRTGRDSGTATAGTRPDSAHRP